jgi:hypothetical protein
VQPLLQWKNKVLHILSVFVALGILHALRMCHTVICDLFGSTVFMSCYPINGGIATRYGLDGPGIESRWGRDFPHPSRPTLGPTQPPIQWVPGLYRG